jgi:drug/metabolite transporter (DMT)-like permease
MDDPRDHDGGHAAGDRTGSAARRRRPPPSAGVLAACALIAFALNSLLCRMALADGSIDALSFTAVRLAAGAAVCLALLVRRGGGGLVDLRPVDPVAGAMLLVYALGFAFAYRDLTAATGALLLFASVQATMIGWGLRCGEGLRRRGWIGLALALAGLVVLTAPGLEAPSPSGAALMATAGVAWGVYSLRGRGRRAPVAATAGNFATAAVLALALFGLAAGSRHASPPGIVLAVLSGAAASALGYVAWYAALRHLRAVDAATLQLLVPLLTALGGTALLGEAFAGRLAAAAAMILGGIAVVIRSGRRAAAIRPAVLPDHRP